jgi:hypothetical protein
MKDNPQIAVELQFVDSAGLWEKLMTASAAGTPPDLVAMDLLSLAQSQRADLLLPLEEVVAGDYFEQFVPTAVRTSLIEGAYYGVPWRRYLCLASFTYLALSKSSQYPTEAFALAQLLASEEAQRENLTKLQWYPTLNALNETVGCAESPLVVVPLPPEEQEAVRQEIENRSGELRDLEGALQELGLMAPALSFNLDQATGLVQGKQSEEILPRGDDADVGPVLVAAVPVTGPEEFFGEERFPEELAQGVVVGAMVVNESDALEVPPGVYSIFWQSEEIFLLDASGSQYGPFGQLGDLNGAAEQKSDAAIATEALIVTRPFVTLERGSWYICAYAYKYCGCIVINNG